ncbi:AAA family ATPase [Streptomyces rubiginosohelvolus]|uniref:AAA family ATPase n=1 Tax=Streptomyces rubiginosohelvolus TaxID=67362 RepID=UPI0037FCF177
MARGLTTIVDSTHLRAPVRAGLLARAARWERPAVAVLFDVPLTTVEAQNAGRDRVVRTHIVREFHRLLPPSASCTTKDDPRFTWPPLSPTPPDDQHRHRHARQPRARRPATRVLLIHRS